MKKNNSEKVSYINTNVLLNNAPKESDDYAVEAEILDAQVKSLGVNNIAVVAPYGAGKSSAIKTYIKRYRKQRRRQPKHIQISLADFNTEEHENPKSKNKNIDDENAIEQSILQQLLYNQKKQKLPNSKIHRTNKSRPLVLAGWGSLAVLFLLSLVTLIFEASGNSLFKDLINNTAFIKPTALCLTAFSLVILLIWFVRTGKLRNLKYKDFEIGIVNNVESAGFSLINKYIDEVLYFFECINIDLVIFEDLDRFDSLRIFVKLRELNTIINNSPKKAKKVTFIYAVKDDMFADEKERSKFFEFILPVIPIINPITTADNVREISKTLDAENNSLALSEQFIKDISYFVTDMRVLKNSFNDYIIMANKLSENSEKRLYLKKENLFALALYKNLYPYDYSRLQGNSGLIPLCVDKDMAVEYFTADLKSKMKELEMEKEKINKEMLHDFNELKLIFKGQHYHLNHSYSSNGQNVDNIDTFKDVVYLAHPQHTYYSVILHRLPNGETYYERELRIKAKVGMGIRVIDEKIRELYKEIDSIENSTLHTLITKMGIETYFTQERLDIIRQQYNDFVVNKVFVGDKSEKLLPLNKSKVDISIDRQIAFVRMLINKDYIDENYLEYISAYKSELSVNDRNFISNVKMGYSKSYSYRLDNVEAVIRELNEEDFMQPAIIINDICRSLDIIRKVDNESDVKTNKHSRIMELFNSRKETVVEAVCAFIMVADTEDKLIFGKHIVENSVSLVETLFMASLSSEDKDMFVRLLAKAGENISEMDKVRQYINEHEKYTALFEELKMGKQCEFIAKGHLIFDHLDISSRRDELFDYIVKNNFYAMNVDNFKAALNVMDSDAEQFERLNYSYIRQFGNEIIIKRIDEDMNCYIENVYVKLPQSNEPEETVKLFLTNKRISEENKSKAISHTDFIVERLDSVNTEYFAQLLNENKVSSNWENIVTAYGVLEFSEPLINFIESNSGNINGSFSDIQNDVQNKLFRDITACDFDESIMDGLARSIDVQFNIDETFGKNDRIGPFILGGCFSFNIYDMRFLKNPPSTIPYLIMYQKDIRNDMQAFFGNTTFKSLTVKDIIEEPKIGVEFKKEFISLYGKNFDISGIEDIVANFIVRRDCALEEGLLYKFTNSSIESSKKLAMLALTIKTNGINNFVDYRSYFCAIGNDFSDFWGKTKKIIIESNIQNRLIAEFMKKNGLIIGFRTNKDRLHITCA